MPWSRARLTLAAAVFAATSIFGCGRTSLYGVGGPDGGSVDSGGNDGGLTDGASADRPPRDGPCAPSCLDLCVELESCGYVYPGGPTLCRTDCENDRWAPATVDCLIGGYCAPELSCGSFRQCIQHPNRSCDDICSFANLCGLATTAECLAVCNAATPSDRACYSRAIDDESCDELRQCLQTPGTPCERICDFAVDSCGASVPVDQCVAFCESQPQSSIQCELQALAAGDCGDLATCFQNPTDYPDLVIGDFYAFVQGTTVYYTATVCNTGGSPAGPFDVEVYYQRPNRPAPGQVGDDARSVAGLQAGSCQTLQLVRPSTPAGTYTSWLQVDAFGQVVEANETNNTAGPYQVVVGGADQCADICALSSFCNLLATDTCMQQCPLWPPAEIACAVKATQNGDCAALKQCITGPQFLPDLVLSAFTAQVAGATVTYHVTACNQGNVAADGFYVDLYYDLAQPPAPWQLGDDFLPISGLQPLQCQDLTFVRSDTPVGSYLSYAQADSDNYVNESEEANNVAGPLTVAVTPAPRPDLTITGFTGTVTGTTVNYQATVCNQGNAPSTATVVDVYFDRPGAPGLYQYGDDFRNLPGLSAGSCATVAVARTNTPGGTYRSWAQVDAENAVVESNEQNNVAGPLHVVVTGPTQQPDLVVESLSVTVFEQSVTYTAVVCNHGSVAAGNAALELYYNRASPPTAGQAGDVRRPINNLGAGQCVTRTIGRNNVPAGTYIAWAYADIDNTVAESNESNNVGGPKGYTVSETPPPPQGSDLIVASLNATVFQGTVTYDVVICNQGTDAAGHFVIDLYYDLATAPAVRQSGDVHADVAGLGAGACTARSFVRSATPDGTYTSWCQVDTQSEVAESDEGNNVAGPVTVTVAGGPGARPDLLVQSFLASVAGDVVTYTAAVCNVGDAAAGPFYVDLYYDLTNAPVPGLFGDQSQGIAGLQPQQCQTLVFTRSSTPTGTYRSWCQVDSAQGVVESAEGNNVAGPAVITISAALDCDQVCTWLTTDCGLPSFLFGVCSSLCGNLSPDGQACVQEAMAAGDCNGTWSCIY